MNLIHLKEGRRYVIDRLVNYVREQSGLDVTESFFTRLKESMNEDFDSTVVRLFKSKQEISFRYAGLYDYFDRKSGLNLTLFFVPKFVDFNSKFDDVNDDQVEAPTGDRTLIEGCDDFNHENANGKNYRDTLLRAIDRYIREKKNQLANQDDIEPEKRTSVLELAVRVLRDYLENGLYLVQRRELERNGQGEIDWNTTIDTFQPMIKKGRPYYMEVLTEQAYSEENHYVTRLQKCLVTTWGRKLEELGLSSVLQVNVPMLSEEELDHFGTPEYQSAQIDRELSVQFVTQSRRTLMLMKELIQRATENKALDYESLSFGMTGAHALWERACAEVLGSELDKKISECGLSRNDDDKFGNLSFREYLPKPCWKKEAVAKSQSYVDAFVSNASNKDGSLHCDAIETIASTGFRTASKSKSESCEPESKKSGWRLDFIRTWRPKDTVEKLVILDAKYYCVHWDADKIFGQPGMADITKQIFYEMAFQNLNEENGNVPILNAFLFPQLTDSSDSSSDSFDNKLECNESVELDIDNTRAAAFGKIKLRAVRIPGMRLLEDYANYTRRDDWFHDIAATQSA